MGKPIHGYFAIDNIMVDRYNIVRICEFGDITARFYGHFEGVTARTKLDRKMTVPKWHFFMGALNVSVCIKYRRLMLS